MTIQELALKLKELSIPEERYYLHGLYGSNNDEKLSLVIKKDGGSLEYEVYFKERGEKHSIMIFSNEDDACKYLYERLKYNKEIEDEFST